MIGRKAATINSPSLLQHNFAGTAISSCCRTLGFKSRLRSRAFFISFQTSVEINRKAKSRCAAANSSGASHLPHRQRTRHWRRIALPARKTCRIQSAVMVSTRHHPRQFPEPDLPPSRTSTPTKTSPTKSGSKSTSRSNAGSAPESPVLDNESPTTSVIKTPKPRARKSSSSALTLTGHTHTPPLPLLAWLVLSLPLVAWDTLYVLLRPHTMPGGKFHSPFWTPYALYGTVDYMYGWPAWNNHNGFTAAKER